MYQIEIAIILWNLGHSFTKIYIVELQIHISFTYEKTNYPSPEEIGNAYEQLAYITSGLQSFLTTLIDEQKIVVAAIGQTIMQKQDREQYLPHCKQH